MASRALQVRDIIKAKRAAVSDQVTKGTMPLRRRRSHTNRDAQARPAVPGGVDQNFGGTQAGDVDSSTPLPGRQATYETPNNFAVEGDNLHKVADTHNFSEVISKIQVLWRRRQTWVAQQTAMTLRLSAICRGAREGERDEGAKLLKLIESDEYERVPENIDAVITCMPLLRIRSVLAEDIKPVEKMLVDLAAQLPVAKWCEDIKGVGINGTSLAALVGECGDISKYRTVSCLWKRLGLAVIQGERQRKKSDVELALLHAYNPRRHAVAWNIGTNIVRAKAKNQYGHIYEKRRAKTAETHPDWTPKHSHNDAVRIVTKEFIKEFYVAWKDCRPKAP